MTTLDLSRFEQHHPGDFDQALAEINRGRKRTHWMWFVFPQITRLGRSDSAIYYGIDSLAEAEAYLLHPILGRDYALIVEAVEQQVVRKGMGIDVLMGEPDDLKLVSSLTLFERVARELGDAAPSGLADNCTAVLDAIDAAGYSRCSLTKRFLEGGSSLPLVRYNSPSQAWSSALGREFELLEVATAAVLVRSAVSALDAGHADLALLLWASVNGDRLLQLWNDGNSAADAQGLPWADSQSLRVASVSDERKPVGEPRRRQIYERDGYRCVYCGIPVVTKWKHGDIPRLVAAFPEVTPELTVGDGSLRRADRLSLRNVDCGKWIWFEASVDHVLPRSRGGSNDDDNLVTACGGCNYSKGDYLLSEMQVVESPQLQRVLRQED